MTDVAENKRLNDEELEAVAGGVTPPTIDPAALASLMHATTGAAIAGGGAYTTPAATEPSTAAPTTTVPSFDLAATVQAVKASRPPSVGVPIK